MPELMLAWIKANRHWTFMLGQTPVKFFPRNAFDDPKRFFEKRVEAVNYAERCGLRIAENGDVLVASDAPMLRIASYGTH